MGNRANFVVVEDQDWRLYYAHWAGCRMLDALIGGPELALRFVGSLRACPKDEWVSSAWADGGALIDLDQRKLLFFSDELMVTMAERRAMLDVLAAVWSGYAVGWAYDGPAELAGYVGAEWRDDPWPKCPTTKLAADRKTLCQVVSVVDPGGQLRLWPLGWTVSQAWHGSAVLDKLPGRGLTRLTLRTLPEGGVHIDVGRQMMAEWHTADGMGICRELADLWPGWQTESWGDRFEEQASRCGPALRLPDLDLAAGADSARAWIRRRVYQSFADSPAGHIAELAKVLDPLAPGLVVDGQTAVNGEARPTAAEWTRFVAACGELRARRAQSA
ncbi:MAG: hypothetical protein ACRDTN_11950 [Mycobacterium sp.]